MFRHILLPAAAPTIFSGFRPDVHSQVGAWFGVRGSGWRRGHVDLDAAFRFEVGEVYAGLVGDTAFDLVSFHD